LISDFRHVLNFVRFFLGDSPASVVYTPTFRNTVSVPSSYLPTYEDGTDRVFWNWKWITQKKVYNIQPLCLQLQTTTFTMWWLMSRIYVPSDTWSYKSNYFREWWVTRVNCRKPRSVHRLAAYLMALESAHSIPISPSSHSKPALTVNNSAVKSVYSPIILLHYSQ
jgi:hypothetical protein